MVRSCGERSAGPFVLLLIVWVSLTLPLTAESLQPGYPYVFANLGEDSGDDAFNMWRRIFPGSIEGLTLFVAYDEFGVGLWRTDGTTEGTFRFLDPCPGPCRPSLIDFPPGVETPGFAFFLTYARSHGTESVRRLWRTDGTVAGTRVLLEGYGTGVLNWGLWIEDQQKLLFNAASAEHGEELWVSDGTQEGTHVLIDLRPGPGSSNPGVMRQHDGLVYFTAYDEVHGVEVWRTDGTSEGTRRVSDVPGSEPPYARALGPVGERMMLVTRHGDESLRLWSTDGTLSGTRPVKDLSPVGFGGTYKVAHDAGRLFFLVDVDSSYRSDSHLWVTDGTTAGTRRLTPHPYPASLSQVPRFAAFGDGRLVFDWHLPGAGQVIWVSDGTLEGTRPLGADGCPDRCWFRSEFNDVHTHYVLAASIHVRDGLAYFIASDGEHGLEPWVSDGTAAGTRMLMDACPGSCDARMPDPFQDVGDYVAFLAGTRDSSSLSLTRGTLESTHELMAGELSWFGPVHRLPDGTNYLMPISNKEYGSEAWISDLTPGGTHLLREPAEAREGVTASSEPEELVTAEGRLFLLASAGEDGRQVWGSDAALSEMHLLEDVPARLAEALEDGREVTLEVAGGRLFAITDVQDGETLATGMWSRRAAAATWTELPALEGGGTARGVPLGDNLLLFNRRHLAVSDGTVAGTRIIGEDLALRHADRDPSVVTVGGHAYFSAILPDDLGSSPSDAKRLYLWRTDGTAAGTVAIHLLGTGENRSFRGQRLGDGLFFVTGGEAWMVDGPGAKPVRKLDLPVDAGIPRKMATVGDQVIFSSYENKLWRTDGTPGGTMEIELAEIEGSLGQLIGLEDRVLVQVHHKRFEVGETIREMSWWSTDGSEKGLIPLPIPRHEDPHSSEFKSMVWPLGRVTLLTGLPDPVLNSDLWFTDGTPEGTHRLPRLAGRITGAVRVGKRVFFGAPHPQLGTELWAINLDGSEGTNWRICEADDETLCLLDGRFQVQVRWHDPRSGREGTAGARPFPGSDRTGTFWFFNPENVELIVKQLDGRDVNDFFWTFYGALTDVEYWIDVTDMENGATQTFYNAPGEICGRGETQAFPSTWVTRPARVGGGAAEAVPSCEEPGSLCLHDDRFVLEVDWRDPRTGVTGSGTAIPGTDRTGYFWFFRQDNVELVAKVLDGTPVNGHHWVFYGSLTDVEYDLWVTDVVSGETRRYHNPPGNVCGGADTAAF